ncbi:hypothetical protein N7474_001324 [Penicillium riverlandense]|uniref:uncharacterized protein n=1 Tax=Penicillium riverlandense TaxID=1903569 RepID=UPI002547B7A9|nr:uncharacterized protein N7474_001324 [Penicillium riverlandense]KAJ5833013.1 hypothetical protein N7474_001324 [Penicillium riverlandense]
MEHISSDNTPIPGLVMLQPWLSANAQKLQPPVNNQCLYSGKDFILMAVGGPNTRNDYHINQTEEWFYQIKGDMLLKIVENGTQFRDIVIREGEMYLLPGDIPHCPIRYKDTVGLVMERTRPLHVIDRIRWYCPNQEAHQTAPSIIREESFHCADIETQLKDLINQWMTNESTRQCGDCGQIAPPQ